MAQATAATAGHTGDLKTAGFKDTARRKSERESRPAAMSLRVTVIDVIRALDSIQAF
jgi:hypothetical protein